MLHTSNYVNLRIIPTFEWDKNTHDVTFDLLYKNFLIDYDLIYPSSGIITPFNQKHFSKINRFLRKIMDESAWGNYLYMPSSRDMPSGKRDLLFRYLEDQNKSLNSK